MSFSIFLAVRSVLPDVGRLSRGAAHGYQIALSVEDDTGGAFSFQHGTLYPILHRLEADGRIQGDWETDTRRRKTYRITDAGRARLEAESDALSRQFDALLDLLGRSDAA